MTSKSIGTSARPKSKSKVNINPKSAVPKDFVNAKRGLLGEDDNLADPNLERIRLDTLLGCLDQGDLTKLDHDLIKILKLYLDEDAASVYSDIVERFGTKFWRLEEKLNARNVPLNCHAFLYWRFRNLWTTLEFPPIGNDTNVEITEEEFQVNWRVFVLKRVLLNAYDATINGKTALENPTKYMFLTTPKNSKMQIARVQQLGVRHGQATNIWLAKSENNARKSQREVLRLYISNVHEGILFGVSDREHAIEDDSVGELLSRAFRGAQRQAQQGIELIEQIVRGDPPNAPSSKPHERDVQDGHGMTFNELQKNIYKHCTEGEPSLKWIEDHSREFSAETVATVLKVVQQNVEAAKRNFPSRTDEENIASPSSLPVDGKEDARPSHAGHGNNVSPFNPRLIKTSSSASVPNPFYETLPGKVVWHRDVASVFPFAETPFMQREMSKRIAFDLLDGKSETTRNGDAENRSAGGFVGGFRRLFGSSRTNESVNLDDDMPKTVYPPPWKLPKVTDVEIEYEMGRKRKQSNEQIGRTEKRARTSREDNNEYVMSGGLGQM